MPRPRWVTRTAQVVAVCLALAVAVAVFIHAPPVRRAALRRAVTLLAERFNLALRAETLAYNLLALRVTLTGVELAATRTPDSPFLTADRLEIAVPTSALFGAFALDRVALDNARVTIVRAADGRFNLPDSTGDDGEPAALPIGRLQVPQLGISVTDRTQNLVLSLPALAVDVGPADGSVRLTQAGRAARGDMATTVSALGGGLAFDGRSVVLRGFALTTPEAAIQADGTLSILVEEPRADLRLSGRGDVARVLQLVPDAPPVSGALAITGTLRGPLDRPDVALAARSDALQWDRLVMSDVDASLQANPDRVQVSRFASRIAGGLVTAAGGFETASGAADLMLSWTDLDLDALMRALAAGGARPAAAATGSASLRGSGSDLRAWTIDARTRLTARPRSRGQVAVGGDAALRTQDGGWALDVDGVVERVPIRGAVNGRIGERSLAASTMAGTVRATDVDLPAVLASLRAAGLVESDSDVLTAGRGDAEVVLAGTVAAPRMQITATARELAASGFSNVSADLTATGTTGEMAVDARVRQGSGNQIIATGTVWPDAARTDLRVAGTVRDWRALQPDLQLEGTADLALQVQGPVDALTARGRVNIENASYAGVGLGAVMADIQGDANVLAIDLTSPELNTRATAKVTLAGDRRAAVEVHVDNADLARLTRDAGAPVALTGRVSLTARGEGPLDDWRRGTADLDLTALDARVGDLPVRLASPGRATYRNETVDVESLEAQLGDTRLSIAGRLPTGASPIGVAPADALRALLVGDMQQVIAALQASGLTDVPDVSARGPIALLARVTGTAERPTVAADLDVGASEIAFGKLPPARIDEARVTVANGWIERLVASGRWQESRVSLEGRAPLHIFRDYLPRAVLDALPGATGTATLDARAQSITPGVLTPFVDPEAVSQIAGVVDASAHLEANSLDLADVRGEVRLDRLDVRVAGLPVTQREPTRIAIGDGVARVVSWDWTGQGATFNVQGEIGLTNQQAALLGAGVVDLRLLAPFVRTAGVGLAGTLAPRFSVSGSLADPRIDGEMSLTDGEIRLAEPRVIATDVEAFAVLSPEQARITTLTGVVNGGTLTGAGEVQYARGQPPSARLSGTIRGMGLDFPEGLRSELNADLAVTLVNEGEQASGRVTGTVTVVRSAYREPIAVAAGLLTALRTERAVVAQADPDALASRLALDVRVVTDSDIIVDNNLARLQLGGDLRVIGTAAAPALAGRAVVREGGQLFLGTNVYRLEDSGAIDFSDSDAIVPDFNLRATTRAGGQRIEVTITGTPENPDLRYFAPESELSQADIASLLLTGRTLSQVSGAEADIVREQVIGLLSGDVLGLASRRVGLDTLRLGGPDASTLRRDAAAVAGETDPTSRMTFGKLIRDNIELTYSQSLRDGDAQTWIVDYRPLTQANVRFVSDDENLRTYEFRHDVSIGGSRTARQERSDQPVRPERIVDVTVNVDRGLQPEALERALTLEQGDVFDFGEWQRDRDRLEELLYEQGRFEARVTAQRLERENGIALVYAIAAGPTTSLDVTGYSLAARAREAIERAWTQSIFDDFLREEAEGIVRGALADDGYLEPRVTSTLETGETKTLHLAVEPGTRTRERRIDIEAGDETLERELDLLGQQRGLVSAWNAPEELRSALINELRARGYLAAEVRTNPPRIESGVAVLPVTIDAGPQFVIEEVTFTGANRIAIDRLREAASLDRGDPYIPAELEAARRRVDVAYRREGFVTTRVTAQPGVDRGSQRVSIAFTIEEGPQQRLREITVSGNRGIDTDVITRAIDLAVGDPIGADAWLEARARLFDTGLFRRVDVTAEPLESAAEGSERPTRLNVVVEEWPALRVRYGLQVSEERPEESVEGRDLTPGLSADVTRRTLFGRAVGVGAAVEYQRRERQARVFMNAPTLFGWPIESLLSAERSHREFAASESATDTSSIAWEQRVGLGRRLQLSYSYRFDRDHTFETRPDDDPLNPIFDITVNVARLTAAGVLDTRDDPTEPSRGLFLSGNVELAPQSLGSDVSFVRELGQAYYFRPWHRVVFASAGRFGVVSPRGGQTLLPSELFLAGGARTVRGVAEEDLGPRDFFGPTGGRALLVLNQEVRFPLFKWVRGVGFFDAGNVFPEPRDIAFGRLVTGVGAGLRVTTPFALLRIDYGRLWTNKGDLRSSEWTFGIGHAF